MEVVGHDTNSVKYSCYDFVWMEEIPRKLIIVQPCVFIQDKFFQCLDIEKDIDSIIIIIYNLEPS